jgi:hypothetical protein
MKPLNFKRNVRSTILGLEPRTFPYSDTIPCEKVGGERATIAPNSQRYKGLQAQVI